MHQDELYALREQFNRERIMLCFNGPISRSLIEEIGNALRRYLEAEQTLPGAATDVFASYIEMTQNIRHYAQRKGYNDIEAGATVIIARNADGHHVVSAGNVVELDDGHALVARVEALAAMDRAALKAAWKTQLRQPRGDGAHSGAGLGLIDIARRCSAPLTAGLAPHSDGRGFFSLRATV